LISFRFPASKRKAKNGIDSNIGHGLFVGWVAHPDIFCWVSFLNPTYLQTIFVPSAKPNKMADDRTIPQKMKQILCALRVFAVNRKIEYTHLRENIQPTFLRVVVD
jgi:hypothetical protein